jgi:deoxyribose-phosphate aldolase
VKSQVNAPEVGTDTVAQVSDMTASAWAHMPQDPSRELLSLMLDGLSTVEEPGVDKRVASLWSRSVKNESQQWALDTAVSMTDLTTLEGADTPGRVRSLCAKAVRPDPADLSCPSVAAVCVYADLVPTACEALAQLGAGSNVQVASVATGFPSGRMAVEQKAAEARAAVAAGADEIDMVIDRGGFLAGRYDVVFNEVRAVKAACGDAALKVILETGELGSLDAVKRASWLTMAAGADTIKTSTGKIGEGATPRTVYVMLTAVREFRRVTGRTVGVKAAGGVRTAKDAVRYLVMVREVAGADWLDPHLFRFGASALLDDLVAQRRHLETGMYPGREYFPKG